MTQYAMTELEQLGFLKMDFLGLKTLTLIKDTVKIAYMMKQTSTQHQHPHTLSLVLLDKRDIGTARPHLRGRLAIITKAKHVVTRSQISRDLQHVEDALNRCARNAFERRWEGGCVGVYTTVVAPGAVGARGFGAADAWAGDMAVGVLLVVCNQYNMSK